VYFTPVCCNLPPQVQYAAVSTLCYYMYATWRSTPSLENEKNAQNAFHVAVTSLSTLSAFMYTLMVHELISPVLLYDRVMLRRVKEGQFPYVIVLICMVPALATGVGMKVRTALYATTINVVLLAFVIRRMSEVIDSIIEQDGADKHHLRESLINDVVVMGAFWSLAWWACATSSEAGEKFVTLLRAGREADSILNHILKNSIAGVASMIELDHRESNITHDRDQEVLQQLHLMMDWCTERQCMIDLSNRTYKTAPRVVNLPKLFSQFALRSEVSCENADCAVDDKMVLIAVENALSNAKSHGNGSVVKLNAAIDVNSRGTWLNIKIRNHVNVADNVTSKQLRGLVRVSPGGNDCESVGPASITRKAGTRSGLRHISLACNGAKGRFHLDILDSDETEVVASLRFPATVQVPESSSENEDSQVSLFQPSGTSCSRNAGDETLPTTVKLCAIDDSKLICKGYERILLPALGLSGGDSKVCCPDSTEAVNRFVDDVIGTSDFPVVRPADVVLLDQNIELKEASTDESASLMKRADAVVLGTDIARDLRKRDYNGLIIIRSANSSAEDKEKYYARGDVDFCVGKASSNKELAKSIAGAYHDRKRSACVQGQIFGMIEARDLKRRRCS